MTLTQSDPAARRLPLDLPADDREGRRYQRQFRPTHLAGDRLQPHRVRRFKLSAEPQFVDKLRDIVGLYVDPPAHAVVFSVDEKSQSRLSIAPSPSADGTGPRRTMIHD